jgi:Predicted membrane protein
MTALARRASVGWLFFSPSGRAGRQVFILGWLFWMMVNSYTLAKTVMHYEDENPSVWGMIFLVTAFLSVVSAIMLTVKRLHDVGLPGLIAVLMFVPVVSLVMLFGLCIWPSAQGTNTFGRLTDWPKDD